MKHLLAVAPYHEGDEHMLVLGCILKMYHSHTLSIDKLKKIFWARPPGEPSELSLKVLPQHHPYYHHDNLSALLQAMLQSWSEQVGCMDDTLHWVDPSLYKTINSMKSLSIEELQAEFQTPDSRLCSEVNGVMDLMLVCCCFRLPLVMEMDHLFWHFARALVLLDVGSVDTLNSLLWGLVLPQTVLVLEPKQYILDSLLDPIFVPITIRGTKDQATLQTTILGVYSQTSLVFFHHVRFWHLTFARVVTASIMPPSDFIVKLIGWDGCKHKAYFWDVEMLDGGISCIFFDLLQCNRLLVKGAECALAVYSTKTLCVRGWDQHTLLPSERSAFDECTLAIKAKEVVHLKIQDVKFSRLFELFNVRASHVCSIEKSIISPTCMRLGRILMPEDSPCIFTDVEVLLALLPLLPACL